MQHNVVLLASFKDPHQRLWYARQAIEHGWSRAVLVHWIESDLYSRQGKAVTNFPATRPPAQSDLAAEVIKDPYSFDFHETGLDTPAPTRHNSPRKAPETKVRQMRAAALVGRIDVVRPKRVDAP